MKKKSHLMIGDLRCIKEKTMTLKNVCFCKACFANMRIVLCHSLFFYVLLSKALMIYFFIFLFFKVIKRKTVNRQQNNDISINESNSW